MRELKFRGELSKDSDCFKAYKKGTIIQGGFCYEGTKTFIVAHFNVFEVKPESVSQFTGSIDSQGKDIYEGDIVELSEGFHPKLRPIVFNEHGAWYIGELGVSFEQMKANGFVDCKIVGNIYENDELLGDVS